MSMKVILPLVGVLGLAACGGGGGGNGVFTDIALETRRLDALNVQGSGYVDVDASAISSDATFTGIALINDNGVTVDTGWTGNATMTYTASNNQVTGTATDFFQSGIGSDGFQTNPVSARGGTLTLSGDASSGTVFAMTVSGTFDEDGTSAGETVTSGATNARFRGPNASNATVIVVDGGFSKDSGGVNTNYQLDIIAD